MSEIVNQFGFDATKALQDIRDLSAGFDNLFKSISQAPQAFKDFNAMGKDVNATLRSIQDQAKATVDALNKVGKVRPRQSRGSGAAPAGPTPQSILAPAQTPFNPAALQGINTANAGLRQALGLTTAIGTQGAPAIQKATNAAGAFGLSLETVTRVLGTQFIVRGLSSIQRQIESSFRDYIDLSQQLVSIQNISGQSFESLQSSIAGTSKEFASPVLDVAAAKYQILQNGFSGAAESQQVLNASLRFARTTMGSAIATADALTSALNAYGKTASEADLISAQMFKTIELGRIDADQLAASFGKIAPAGAAVGASMEELLGLLSSITIGGVSGPEAATQINSLLNAFIKPSEAAKKALEELGFSTGQQAIEALGLVGATQALIATTDGSSTSIGKLFNNIRAGRGVLRTVANDAAVFTAHLADIEKQSLQDLEVAYGVRIESNADQVQAQLTQLKNFFTVEIGQGLVEDVGKVLSVIPGGVDTLTAAIQHLVPVMITAAAGVTALATAVGLYAGVQRLMNTQMVAGSRAMSGLIKGMGVLTVLYAAFELGGAIGQLLTNRIEAQAEAIRKANEDLSKDERKALAARVQADNKANNERTKNIQKYTAEVRKMYIEEQKLAENANKSLVNGTKEILDRLVQSRQEYVNTLQSESKRAGGDVQSSQGRVTTAKDQRDDLAFDRQQRGRTDPAAFQAALNRARELASQGSSQLASARTEEDQRRAEQLLTRAESFRNKAQELAGSFEPDSSTQKTALNQVDSLQRNMLDQRISAEEQLQGLRQKDQQQLAKSAQVEQQKVDILKQQSKELLEAINLQGKSPAEAQAGKQRAQELLNQIREGAAASGGIDLSQFLSMAQLQDQLNKQLSGVEIQQLNALPSALDSLHNQVQDAFNQKQIIIDFAVARGLDPAELEGLTGLEQVNVASNFNQEATKELEQQKILQAQIVADQLKLNGLKQSAADQLSTLQPGDLATGFGTETTTGLASLVEKYRALAGQARISKQEVTALGEAQNAFDAGRAPVDAVLELGVNQQLRDLVAVHETLKQIATTQATINANQQLRQDSGTNIQQSQEVLRAQSQSAQEALKQSTANQSTATGATSAASALQQAVAPAQQVATAMQLAANAAQILSTMSIPSPSTTKAWTGGYFAGGGKAQGADTIPAMLSPGEFVVNSKSSRRFFSQLNSMNAQGVYRQQGGSVGDMSVNITNNHPTSENYNARQIASQLERLRRRRAIR